MGSIRKLDLDGNKTDEHNTIEFENKIDETGKDELNKKRFFKT